MKHVTKHIFKSLLLITITVVATSLPVTSSFGNLDHNGSNFNCLRIGGAYVVFAGKTGGEIRKSELAGQTEIRVDGCAKGYKVISYTLEITMGHSKSTYQSNSNQLTTEMKEKLQRLTKGDKFEFKLMKASQEDKHIVDVHGGIFTVV